MKLVERKYQTVHFVLTSLITTGIMTLFLNFLSNRKIDWFIWLKTWSLVFVLILILSRIIPNLVNYILKKLI